MDGSPQRPVYNFAYWVVTGLFCAVLAFSGIAHFSQLEDILQAMTAMGYPPFFMRILGVAKLLGVVALLAPGYPLLKEWAYAGFAFNLIGALLSHMAVGDPFGEWLPPIVLLGLAAASYHLRPADRRLVPGSPS